LRPLASGVLQPQEALIFGVALAIAGAVDLYLAAGALASGLGIATCLSYLLAYTPLKKRTVWATFVGAFPGAIPPMIGWVAATGSLDRGAWLLFGILFLWQFPHFHAIAWMYREDYARAGILMLPVVDREGTRTFRQIILYAAALVGVSLLPAILGLAGVVYFFGALVSCTALLQVCLWAASKNNRSRKGQTHIHVLATSSQCHSECNQRPAPRGRLCRNPSRKNAGTQEIYGFRVLGFRRVPGVLRELSPARKASRPLPRTGLDQAGLLHVTALAYDPGNRDCAVDPDYVAPRLDGEIRQTQADCAMDAAIVVLCLRHRGNRLFYGLPDLCSEERLRRAKSDARNTARIAENCPAGTPAAPGPRLQKSGQPGECRTWEIRCARNPRWD